MDAATFKSSAWNKYMKILCQNAATTQPEHTMPLSTEVATMQSRRSFRETPRDEKRKHRGSSSSQNS
jgi:hypothetical protein